MRVESITASQVLEVGFKEMGILVSQYCSTWQARPQLSCHNAMHGNKGDI
jgi:hypothetical protein